MWEAFLNYVEANKLGDLASLFGLVITLIGFAVTIWKVLKIKKTSEKAQEIVEKIREDVIQINFVSELTKAISEMDEIKRLHRENAWVVLPDRYSSLMKTLISVENSKNDFNSDEKVIFRRAILMVRDLEQKIEKHLDGTKEISEISSLNRSISNELDSLQKVLVKLKMK